MHSTYGDVAQRWLLSYSAPRRGQAQRPGTKRGLKHSEQEVNAFQQLCRTAFACAAEARQAVDTCATGLHSTALQAVILRSTAHYDKPGQPKADDLPAEIRVPHGRGARFAASGAGGAGGPSELFSLGPQ